jgi:hypothetical protein
VFGPAAALQCRGSADITEIFRAFTGPGSRCTTMAFVLPGAAKPCAILSLEQKYGKLQRPAKITSICRSSEALLQNPIQLSHFAGASVATTKASQITLLGVERTALLGASCRLHSLGGSVVAGSNAARVRGRRERSIAAADGQTTLTTASEAEEVEEEVEDLSRAQLLWRAAKLPLYSVAIVPLSVSGLFLASFTLITFKSLACICCCL